jgi:tRNA G10  N-methylase Trm11
MGIENRVGFDISQKAVASTKENMAWLYQHYPKVFGKDRIEFCDAKDLPKQLKPGSVNVIVTEPYLGPPQRGKPTGHAVLPLVSALSKQYTLWIRAMSEVLREGGRLAMIWPFFRLDKHGYFLQLQGVVREAGLRPIVPPAWLVEKSWFRSTPRGTILYSRPDQIVGREIVLLGKHAP